MENLKNTDEIQSSISDFPQNYGLDVTGDNVDVETKFGVLRGIVVKGMPTANIDGIDVEQPPKNANAFLGVRYANPTKRFEVSKRFLTH